MAISPLSYGFLRCRIFNLHSEGSLTGYADRPPKAQVERDLRCSQRPVNNEMFGWN